MKARASRAILPRMPTEHSFRPALFRFLRDLKQNNERAWFQAHKGTYEDVARGPAMEFIAAVAPGLARVSKHIRADPRPVGGSLFRIHRDVRFARDKSPYKTHVGIHFRHAAARDAHAPGYYLHLEPKSVFFGCGIWHPDATTAKSIRATIVAHPAAWKKAVRSRAFARRFELAGESLKRPPRDFDSEHALVEDLKRKDFIAVHSLKQAEVTRPDFDRAFVTLCAEGAPLMRFLCRALGLPF